jgi:hypothetical protein
VVFMQRSVVTMLILGCACLANGWLFFTKIMPTLTPGDPPGYQALFSDGDKPLPVGWTIMLNDTVLGTAISLAEPTDNAGMIVRSTLRLDDLPIEEIVPAWTRLVIGNVLAAYPAISLEASGRMHIDAGGNLRHFQSVVQIPGSDQKARLEGTISQDNHVTVSLRAGGASYEASRFLPLETTIGDELSPQATMPGLYQGRRWIVPVFSPLRPSAKPLVTMYARVDSQESVHYGDQTVTADIVCYRDSPGEHHPPRSRMWVDPRGRVLRHESMILGSKLQFVRCPDDVAASLTDQLAHHDDRFNGFAPLGSSPRLETAATASGKAN